MHYSTSYSPSNLHCFLTDRHGHAVKKKRQKSELSNPIKNNNDEDNTKIGKNNNNISEKHIGNHAGNQYIKNTIKTINVKINVQEKINKKQKLSKINIKSQILIEMFLC